MTVRVAVIGNHAHPFCSEVHWTRAFAENGCEVTPLQVDDVVRNPEEAMAVLRRQSIVTYTRTHSAGRYLDASWTDRWAELERAGVRTIGIHLDRYWDLEREHLITGEPRDAQFTMGLVATADGGNDDRWEAAGVNHVWFRPGVDRVEALVDGVSERVVGKIVFTGSGGQYHGEYGARGDLLSFLKDRYRRDFLHYGHGGDFPVVRQDALNAVLQSAAVVVGDSCFLNGPDGQAKSARYVSDRLYESIGRGAFLLFPMLPSMEEDFGIVPGIDCATYTPGDWDSLARAIEIWWALVAERRQLATDGRRHVLREHTYTSRMADLLATVGLTVDARAS